MSVSTEILADSRRIQPPSVRRPILKISGGIRIYLISRYFLDQDNNSSLSNLINPKFFKCMGPFVFPVAMGL